MNKKVILINLPPAKNHSYENKGGIYPSTALLLIGSILKKNGYDATIIDGAYHHDYMQQIETVCKECKDILYIGIYVMVTQIPLALEASIFIKGINKNIPIVWGGPHPTLYPKQTLENKNIDVVVINEGASTSLSLAKCFQKNKSLETIKGIGFKKKNGELCFTEPSSLDDINELPFFDFSLIDTEKYVNPKQESVYAREFPNFKEKIKIIPILTALGCPYSCQFCINVILKRKYRFRSADSIIKEIKRLKKEYNANTFLFLDEDFFISKKRVNEFINLAKKEKLKFNFRAWCRVDHFKESFIDENMLKELGDIGHVSLAMGGESANPEILEELNKGITPEQIIHSLKTITKSNQNIHPRYSFMVGLENETLQQIKKTYEFCNEMKKINPHVDIAGPFAFRLYPGSPIFNRLTTKYNIKIPNSLESWAEEITNVGGFSEMSWTPYKFQKQHKSISFYFSKSSEELKPYKSKKKKMMVSLLSKISRSRMRRFVFYLPLEYWLHSIYLRVKSIIEN